MASVRIGVRPRHQHTRREITAQSQLGTQVANRSVSRPGVTSPKTLDRELVDHARESRDLRQLVGRREPPLQRILNGLRRSSGIGRRSVGTGRRSTSAEPPRRTASFANRDHAPSHFRIQRPPTLDTAPTADLSEIPTEGSHGRNVSCLRSQPQYFHAVQIVIALTKRLDRTDEHSSSWADRANAKTRRDRAGPAPRETLRRLSGGAKPIPP
jgi:hypothetical protein